MGSTMVNAAMPNHGNSSTSIASVPYAEEEMQSGESTPSATVFESFWCRRSAEISGRPSRAHLMR